MHKFDFDEAYWSDDDNFVAYLNTINFYKKFFKHWSKISKNAVAKFKADSVNYREFSEKVLGKYPTMSAIIDDYREKPIRRNEEKKLMTDMLCIVGIALIAAIVFMFSFSSIFMKLLSCTIIVGSILVAVVCVDRVAHYSKYANFFDKLLSIETIDNSKFETLEDLISSLESYGLK